MIVLFTCVFVVILIMLMIVFIVSYILHLHLYRGNRRVLLVFPLFLDLYHADPGSWTRIEERSSLFGFPGYVPVYDNEFQVTFLPLGYWLFCHWFFIRASVGKHSKHYKGLMRDIAKKVDGL